jgi:regulatory protein
MPEYTRTSDKRRFKPTERKKPEKPPHSSRSYAVWLLSKREYSAATLRQKLLTRGYSAEETDEAMQFVQTNNYQSDERYAGMKARSTAHRAGNRKISMALAQKGIDENTAKEQIAELAPEEERAVQAAISKFSRHVSAEGMTADLQKKVWRFLGYRGFSGKAIKAAIDRLKEGI